MRELSDEQTVPSAGQGSSAQQGGGVTALGPPGSPVPTSRLPWEENTLRASLLFQATKVTGRDGFLPPTALPASISQWKPYALVHQAWVLIN